MSEKKKLNPAEIPYRIIRGDCREMLPKIAAGSVQCVVTSPPYFNCRTYGDDEHEVGREKTPWLFVKEMTEIFAAVRRVLKDDGVVWLNIGDCIAKRNWPAEGNLSGIKKGEQMLIPTLLALELRRDGWYVQQDVIWAKTNPMPSSTPKRCTPSHEYIFMLSKSETYKFDPEPIMVDAKVDNSKSGVQPPIGGKKKAGGDNSSYSGNQPKYNNKARKRDVWFETTSKNPEAHFAPFPKTIVAPCILATTKEGDRVLDPFSGSGTTGAVAVEIGRRFVGIELYEKYVEMSEAKRQKVGKK